MKAPTAFRFVYYAKRHLADIAVFAFFSLIVVALGLATPWPMKFIIDNVLSGQDWPSWAEWVPSLPGAANETILLVWMCLVLVGLFLVRRLIEVVQTYMRTMISHGVSMDFASDVFDQLQHASLVFHRRIQPADAIKRVTRDTGCASSLVFLLIRTLMTICTLAATIFILVKMDVVLALVGAGVLVPIVLISPSMMRRIDARSSLQLQREADVMGVAEQGLYAVPVIQAYNWQELEVRRFRYATDLAEEAYLGHEGTNIQYSAGVSSSLSIGLAIVTMLGAFSVLDGRLTVGDLVVVLAYVQKMYGPLSSLLKLPPRLAVIASQARRILEIPEFEPSGSEAPRNPRPVGRSTGRPPGIRFERVGFSYDGSTAVLQDIDLNVEPGERIGVVGRIGAGKSTMLGLVPRLFEPNEGRVLLDGVDSRRIDKRSLRERIAVVLQEPYVLNMTVAENISYGCRDAPLSDIEQAARLAGAAEFIDRLPNGYHTIIGQGGTQLSGGERQRVAIARAALRSSDIVLLDEPTSALDVATESAVLDSLQRVTAGKTTFLITHRLSSLRIVDRIIVLDKGKIVEDGTHAELMDAAGLYQQMYIRQIGKNESVGESQ